MNPSDPNTPPAKRKAKQTLGSGNVQVMVLYSACRNAIQTRLGLNDEQMTQAGFDMTDERDKAQLAKYPDAYLIRDLTL